MMTGFAETYIGAGHRFVAPSRFGYLGSSLPAAALPADQADAHAVLLDALGIDRAAVFGYSGGGPSAIQFAFRHAGRITALILMASALPGKAGAPPKVVAQAFFGSDLLFWILKSYAPSLFTRILGMPKGFRPAPQERERIEQTMDSLFPIRPRKRGVLFDLYMSNPDVQSYPLEELSVPVDVHVFLAAHRSALACKRSLRPAGRYLYVGGSMATLLQVLLIGPLTGRAAGKKIRLLAVRLGAQHLAPIVELCQAAKIATVIDGRYRLSEVPEALRYLGEGHAKGKVVVIVE
jgi:pimeloyl-ACP methyl ester carboxylesterase